MKNNTFLILILLIVSKSNAQDTERDSFLYKLENYKTGEFCIVNKNQDTIIPFGMYEGCYSDSFRHYAIVWKYSGILYAINRKGKEIYQVYPYDTGPDIPYDSLFRIIVDRKIGFAHQRTGEIIIQPEYKCASSFISGTAMVSSRFKCLKSPRLVKTKEKHWMHIDIKGNRIQQPSNIDFNAYMDTIY